MDYFIVKLYCKLPSFIVASPNLSTFLFLRNFSYIFCIVNFSFVFVFSGQIHLKQLAFGFVYVSSSLALMLFPQV